MWGGLPFEDLDKMAATIQNTSWSNAQHVTIYNNEAMGPIVDGKTAFGTNVNYSHVPLGIDWISFDFYNPPASYVM